MCVLFVYSLSSLCKLLYTADCRSCVEAIPNCKYDITKAYNQCYVLRTDKMLAGYSLRKNDLTEAYLEVGDDEE